MLALLNKAKWLVGGNFIFAFSQWVILILLARMTTQGNLGQYALALAIVTPIFAVSNLQLRPLYILDFNSVKKYDYSLFYYLRLVFSVLAFIICIVAANFSNVLLPVLIVVALLKFFESYSDIIYAYYNAHDKTRLISKSLFFKGVFSVFAIFLGLYFFGFYTALILFLLVYGIVWLLLDNLYILKTKELRKRSLDLSIMKSAIPMGISLGLVTLQSNIPRFFLDRFYGVESVGIFTVLSYFIIVGGIFINSICQYLSPRLTRAWNNDLHEFKKILFAAQTVSCFLGFSAIVFCYFFGEFLLNFIYGSKFITYGAELKLVMLAGLVLYISTVLGYTLTSIGFVKKQVYLFAIVLLIVLMSCYFLIPLYGVKGGILSLIISYSVQFVLSFFIIFYHIKERVK